MISGALSRDSHSRQSFTFESQVSLNEALLECCIGITYYYYLDKYLCRYAPPSPCILH